jgi:DNA-binding transcriptional LysR family regulator
MIDLADLRFIEAISVAPSLAAAARALDVTPPAVSQRLAQLEARLKLKLVERGAGVLRLTAEGEMMAARAQRILADMVDLASDLAERRGAISGPLRVIAPFGFGRLHVAPLIASFSMRHPEVSPMLTVTDNPLGALRMEAWDVLVHIGHLPDLDLIQRKLAANRRLLCASPAYLERYDIPEEPKDLARHRCGVIRQNQADVTLWSFADGSPASFQKRRTVRIEPAFASNDGEVVRQWALAGMGIVERSEWSVLDDLRSGRLVQVLPQWSLPDADIVALSNPRSVRASRVEAFLHHMMAGLAGTDLAGGDLGDVVTG